MDIVITTPKSEIKNAAKEAALAIDNAKKYGEKSVYFRRFKTLPNIDVGDRVFYVEDGWIVGYPVVSSITKDGDAEVNCDATGRAYIGNLVFMRADSWTWIKPISMTGFQGFRYAVGAVTEDMIHVVGDWLDSKPQLRKDGDWCKYSSKEDCNYHNGCRFHT